MNDCYAEGGEVKPESTGSPLMDMLREYVLKSGGLGGHDVKEYDLAQNVDTSTGTAKGYWPGGTVSADDIPANFDWLKGAAEKASMPMPQDPAQTLSPVAARIPPMPVAPPPAPSAPRSLPTATPASALMPNAAPAMPPPGLSDLLAQDQKAGAQAAGPYTPEARAQLYAYLAAKQNSTPNAVGNTLASIGDAITRGYGRSQSDFQNSALAGEAANRKEATDAFDQGAKMHQQETQQGMELSETDPSSVNSRMTQQAYAPILQKMGYSRNAIAGMPASKISTITELGLKFADIQTQKELKDATLALQGMQAKASMANAQTERQQTAAKTIASEGPLERLTNKIFGNKGMETLESELPGQSPVTQAGWKYVGKVGQ